MSGFGSTEYLIATLRQKNLESNRIKASVFGVCHLYEIGDAVVPQGTSKLPRIEPTQDLVDFARKFRAKPSQNLRPKGGFVMLAGEQIPWTRFQQLITKATEVHLL
jgi:hypothetical protein